MSGFDPEIPLALRVPAILRGCWRREYIHQTLRSNRVTDNPDLGIVWYLQAENGLCVDCRIDLSGGSIEHDCFLGVALWDASSKIVNWHPAVTYTSTISSDTGTLRERLSAAASKALRAPSCCEDRGVIEWVEEGSVWLETDVAGGKAVLEEKWSRWPLEGLMLAMAPQCDVQSADVTEGDSNSTVLRDWFDHNDSGEELLLRHDNHFSQVLLKSDGTTVFSMGRINSEREWTIELSTDPKKKGKVVHISIIGDV